MLVSISQPMKGLLQEHSACAGHKKAPCRGELCELNYAELCRLDSWLDSGEPGRRKVSSRQRAGRIMDTKNPRRSGEGEE